VKIGMTNFENSKNMALNAPTRGFRAEYAVPKGRKL